MGGGRDSEKGGRWEEGEIVRREGGGGGRDSEKGGRWEGGDR